MISKLKILIREIRLGNYSLWIADRLEEIITEAKHDDDVQS